MYSFCLCFQFNLVYFVCLIKLAISERRRFSDIHTAYILREWLSDDNTEVYA